MFTFLLLFSVSCVHFARFGAVQLEFLRIRYGGGGISSGCLFTFFPLLVSPFCNYKRRDCRLLYVCCRMWFITINVVHLCVDVSNYL